MQAAGGIDYLVTVAERVIRSPPQFVNILAPLVTFVFCAGSGTGNIIFPPPSGHLRGLARARHPTAATVVDVGHRPDRSRGDALGLGQNLAITLPASVIGVVVTALVTARRGRELEHDAEYQHRLAAGAITPPRTKGAAQTDTASRGKPAALVFIGGVLLVVLLGAFDVLQPTYTVDGATQTLSLTTLLILLILLILLVLVVALAVMYVGRIRPEAILDAPLTKSGLTAIIALLGIAWLANTFIQANQDTVSAP